MKTLLVVDDDLPLRKQIAFALQKEYAVLEAGTPAEASTLIDLHRIDIALVDLGLPPSINTPEEGMKLCRKLLESGDAKVLVLTGQDSEESARTLIEEGVFDYLNKPLELPRLVDAIRRAAFFLDHEEGRDERRVRLTLDVAIENGFRRSSDEAQKQLLLTVLRRNGFNVYQTAKELGVKRENIYYFLKKFDIERPDG